MRIGNGIVERNCIKESDKNWIPANKKGIQFLFYMARRTLKERNVFLFLAGYIVF